MIGSRIVALGAAVPEQELTNEDLAGHLGVTEEWIFSRTGIVSRRLAAPEETAASLGAQAASEALSNAGLRAEEVDLIICATITANGRFPATACVIGSALGTTAAAWDLNAGCSGFLFALAQADAAIRSGSSRRVLIVGTEVMSRITDRDDPKTAILFGDGAGAAILEAAESSCLGPFELFSDGSRPDLLYTDERDLIQMQGREVYRAAVDAMSSSVTSLLSTAGVAIQTVDLFVAHQANARIVDAVGARLGLTQEQVVSNIERYGNTSAASIPLALYDAEKQGRLREDDLVLLTAFGAGFCWGAGILRWAMPTHAPIAELVGATHE